MRTLFRLCHHAYTEWTTALSQSAAQEVAVAVHYLILALLCALATVHIVFTVYFFHYGITPMIVLDIGTLIFYIACITYKIRNEHVHDLFIAIIVLEVCLHALLATYYVGWNSGFGIYLMVVSVILAVVASTSIFSRVAAMIILSTVLIAIDLYFSHHTPVYLLSKEVIDNTRIANYSTALFQLSISAMGYQYLLAVANTKMDRLANEDQLTGQMNRRAMIAKGQKLIEQCQAARVPLCAAIGDLDHFKHINDTYGHTIGDEVLVAVSKTIHESSRTGDLTGRWGGEEFVWLLPNSTPAQATEALNRLRKRVQALLPSDPETPWQASISIGLTQLQPSEDFDKAISRADQALYQAKEYGRNRIELALIELPANSQSTPPLSLQQEPT